MTTQHTGAAGELLVQYKLLKLGIDSARLTTDTGIDLVVYSPTVERAVTVQVKSNVGPKPSGGHGPLSRGWFFPHACPAQMLAFVALDVDKVWLFTIEDARSWAQQHSAKGVHQIYWRIEYTSGKALRAEADMDEFLLERCAESHFVTAT